MSEKLQELINIIQNKKEVSSDFFDKDLIRSIVPI